MAHPCFDCGDECYCNGDWDDIIVSKTPLRCESCDMCQEMEQERKYEEEETTGANLV